MKRFAIIVAVVIAVLAVLIAAAPFVVPSDFLKQRVAERIAALTGRTVTLAGVTTLSIYPHLAISADGLAIGNPEGMGSDPMIAADRLETRVRLLPLLVGRLEFDEFTLTSPTIHLVVDAQGHPNWGFAASAVGKQASSATPSADPLALSTELRLGHLTLTNGTVLYDNLASDTREQMTGLDLDIDWPSISATASGRGKLTWRGEAVEFTGLLAAPLELMRGKATAARFALASTPLRASFSGRATESAGLRLDGDATISTPSMRRTIEWLGTPMGTGPILGAASVHGTVAIAGASVEFSRANLELDGNSAEGSLGVNFAGAKPHIAGQLTSQRLDLSAYLEAVRADLVANGSWLIAPARLPFAEAVDADITFTTGAVVMDATEIGDTWSTVKIKDNGLDVALQGADLYGGAIGVHVTTTSAGNVLSANGHLDIKGVPATPTLRNLAGISALDGSMTGTFELAAAGRGWGEIVSRLAGSGQISIDNGTLTGIDLPAIAYVLADPSAGPVLAGGGTTHFASMTADLNLAAGDIRTNDLFMEGVEFRLALAGHGSLTSGATEARATLTNATETIPLSIAGTWQQPAIARAAFRAAEPRPAEDEH